MKAGECNIYFYHLYFYILQSNWNIFEPGAVAAMKPRLRRTLVLFVRHWSKVKAANSMQYAV